MEKWKRTSTESLFHHLWSTSVSARPKAPSEHCSAVPAARSTLASRRRKASSSCLERLCSLESSVSAMKRCKKNMNIHMYINGVCVCVHVCVYIYICICVYIYIYVYTYKYRLCIYSMNVYPFCQMLNTPLETLVSEWICLISSFL